MVAGNSSFDTFATSTIKKYHKTLVENIFAQEALFWQLGQRGFIVEDRGGSSIVEPIMYGQNGTTKAYGKYELLDLSPQDGITAAEFDWKYVAASVTISGQEEFENSGSKERIINLLEAKIRQAELSMQHDLNRQLYADGTGAGGKEITGLALAVEDGASWSTYGGIDSSDADNAWWRNQYFDFDTVYGGSSTFGQANGNSVKGLSALRKMYTSCLRGGNTSRPTLIVTTSDLVQAYEAEIQGDHLRVMDRSMADAGFMNIAFKGVPMIFDTDMDAEGILFLNSNYLRFVVGRGKNFTSTPFQRPENQDAKVSHILFAGNLTCTKRDQHGRITGVTP